MKKMDQELLGTNVPRTSVDNPTRKVTCNLWWTLQGELVANAHYRLISGVCDERRLWELQWCWKFPTRKNRLYRTRIPFGLLYDAAWWARSNIHFTESVESSSQPGLSQQEASRLRQTTFLFSFLMNVIILAVFFARLPSYPYDWVIWGLIYYYDSYSVCWKLLFFFSKLVLPSFESDTFLKASRCYPSVIHNAVEVVCITGLFFFISSSIPNTFRIYYVFAFCCHFRFVFCCASGCNDIREFKEHVWLIV